MNLRNTAIHYKPSSVILQIREYYAVKGSSNNKLFQKLNWQNYLIYIPIAEILAKLTAGMGEIQYQNIYNFNQWKLRISSILIWIY